MNKPPKELIDAANWLNFLAIKNGFSILLAAKKHGGEESMLFMLSNTDKDNYFKGAFCLSLIEQKDMCDEILLTAARKALNLEPQVKFTELKFEKDIN